MKVAIAASLMEQFDVRPDRVPTRTVLISIAGIWLCYLALITLRSLLLDRSYFVEMLGLRTVVTLAGITVTALAWLILRLFDNARIGIRMGVALVVMLPAALGLAMINRQVFSGLDQKMLGQQRNPTEVQIRHDTAGNVLVDVPDPPNLTPDQLAALQKKFAEQALWRQLTDIAIGRYFLLLAWAALYFAMVTAQQARAAERREGEYKRAAKAAELRSLRYQVNPHFLFNTLNSLSALVMTGKGHQAEKMIQSLSSFYRRSLAEDPTGDVSLDQEMALQRAYLEIEAARFPDRLITRFDIPEALEDARVPGMILQPLVENAVKYAVAPTRQPVTVTIAAREEYGRLVIEVSDNGPGVPKGEKSGFGIGLANVHDRIEARYGQDASLAAGPDQQGGWHALLRMPLERHAG
ncbi:MULTISPECIES: histidine kinase [unclassified Novosphingobium]|uniref:sensor histidine kinase n=1 Tax=unclassified Novosphingobium TaxID=2644732 RepID=UPI0025E933C8|nr:MULTISPECIES: histidine kinase [unclassified Novosphingobium]HQV02399.1 histidine kinase [Novosphingobium sp.]